jgi:hypothetical protein
MKCHHCGQETEEVGRVFTRRGSFGGYYRDLMPLCKGCKARYYSKNEINRKDYSHADFLREVSSRV